MPKGSGDEWTKEGIGIVGLGSGGENEKELGVGNVGEVVGD